LYYYRARYYDPTIGRFLQPDPLDMATIILIRQYYPEDSISELLYQYSLENPLIISNLYPYVGNNPVNLIDPLGLFRIDIPWDYVYRYTEPEFWLYDRWHQVPLPGPPMYSPIWRRTARGLRHGEEYLKWITIYVEGCPPRVKISSRWEFIREGDFFLKAYYEFGWGRKEPTCVAFRIRIF
jgi:RHS repeat-associated protein